MSENLPSRRKYSFLYKVYRRIRYLRYLKKVRRQRKKEARILERENKERLESILEQQAIDNDFRRKINENKAKQDYSDANTDYDIKEEVSEELLTTLKEVSDRQKKEAIEQRIHEKHRRKRIIRYLVKRKTKQLFNAVISLNFTTIKKIFISFREARSQRQEFFTILINSTSYFLFSYFLIFFLTQLFSAVAASFFDYETLIKYNNNFYLVKNEDWFMDSVKTIYSAGPVTALIIGIISSIIYSRIKEHISKVKIFFLWTSVHAYSFFFGGLLIGTLFSKGFGHVVIWSYIMDTGKLVYSMISIFFLVLVGFILSRSFIISANSYYNKLDESNRSRFVNGQILFPFILGNIVMLIFWLPEFNFYFQLVSFSSLLIILPVWLRKRTFNDMYFEEEDIKVNIDHRIIILALLFISAFRIIFGFGIRIG